MEVCDCRSKETDGMEKNDLGFELSPPCDNVYGTVLAFLVGVNGKPIDLSISQYKRSKKNLRKKQNANNQKEEETTTKESNGDAEDEEVDESDKNQTEVHLQGLPYDTTEETIREFLGECGTIKEVRIPTFSLFVSLIADIRTRDAAAAMPLFRSRTRQARGLR